MLICINGVAAKSFCCRRKSFDHLIGNGESSTPIRLISRRFIAAHDTNAQDRRSKAFGKGLPMSALGHKQTYALDKAMSALPRIATAKADFRKRSCLLYPNSGHVRCKKQCLLRARSGHGRTINSCCWRHGPTKKFVHPLPDH